MSIEENKTTHRRSSEEVINIEQMIAEGDTVATRVTFRGTHTGDFLGIPATGKHVVVPALDMLRYANGKLVEHWGGA